jgi:hypothetical protein
MSGKSSTIQEVQSNPNTGCINCTSVFTCHYDMFILPDRSLSITVIILHHSLDILPLSYIMTDIIYET